MRKIPRGKLYPLALRLAKEATLEELFTKTRLPISWLRKFRSGSIPRPSVQRVERVIVAMTGKELV